MTLYIMHLYYGCGSKPFWYHFWVGEFTTHLRTYFSGWIGMFGGTIWILTHSHVGAVLYSFARDWALGPHLRGSCADLRAHSGAETRFR